MSRGRTISQMGTALLVTVLFIGAGESPNRADGMLGKDGAPMVVIPEGPFTMGSNDGSGNERPEHTVFLSRYAIDQFEVTMSLYAKFLEETGRKPPPLWDEDSVTSAGNRPTVGVTWGDAQAYCKWAGKRLPTEAEWEKAARGTDGRRFPWGNMQPFVDIANYNRGQWVSYAITLAPVDAPGGMSVRHGTKEGGKSPYGVFHMAGNAAEWVDDWYDREYYQRSPEKNPTGPESGEKRVIRGGSWNDIPAGVRATVRVAAEPSYRDLTLGFRCALDHPQ
ncbi:MAG: formylglycine-generating enzyme family protein [Nitrospiraceae bacterium]